jgi:aryl-alcohol dehydrogenase
MTMLAAAVVARGEAFRMMELQIPEPGPGDVRVAMKAAGICHTDLAFRDMELGTGLPIILGHEGAGVIDAVGAGVTAFAVGDRVALSYDSCGHCPNCHAQAPQYCAEIGLRNFAGVSAAMLPPLRTADGAPVFGNFFGQSSFAPFAIAHGRNVVKIPDALPFHLAAPLGCGMQTGAGAVLNTLAGPEGRSLVVLGAGAVGLAAVMAARQAGFATIVAVDRVTARLALARELGATHAISGDGLEASLAAIAPAPQGGAAFDAVIDTTGAAGLIAIGVAALGARGTLLVLAVSAPGSMAEFPLSGFLAGKRIQGVIEGDADPRSFVPLLADMHLAGRFPHDRLVRTYPFRRINDACHDMDVGVTVKPVLLFD